MFDDEDKGGEAGHSLLDKAKKAPKEEFYRPYRSKTSFFNIWIVLIIVFIAASILIIFAFIFNFSADNSKKSGLSARPIASTSDMSTLTPESTDEKRLSQIEQGLLDGSIKAEQLAFGDFYYVKKEPDDLSPGRIELPLNVKTDAANYYKFIRKINLDDYIEPLNTRGFAVIGNPFSETEDFFSAYHTLIEKEAPILLTNDFLMYYTQNTYKQVFKEIEENVFYRDVWDIGLKMYEMADSRYRQRLKDIGTENDRILEGQRLAAAYFAIALEILKPKDEQINQDKQADDAKFYQEEADEYIFSLPYYLENDVLSELENIKNASSVKKSPVFLYNRDYSEFRAPDEYKTNAKLYNFYQAMRWLNSLFPLYYIDEACQDCLVDRDDWIINAMAAGYIAKDFNDNQDIKNQWAKIYKVISFFSGLRSDLTYLHYVDAYKKLFSDKYDLLDIFSQADDQRRRSLEAIAKELENVYYLEIEGYYNRDNPGNKKNIGMRMLQDSYWPDNYIFNQLVAPEVTEYTKSDKEMDKSINKTACKKGFGAGMKRCNIISLDLVNLIYPIAADNNFFAENSSYLNYASQSENLRNQLNNFNLYTWHNNIYWTTLDIARKFLNNGDYSELTFKNGPAWEERKINFALGAWANSQLPLDLLEYYWKSSGGLSGNYISDYNYVEPDLEIISELIANTDMLARTLLALKVVSEAGITYKNVIKLSEELNSVKEIMLKEYRGQPLSQEEINAINNLARQYRVKKSGEKVFNIDIIGEGKIRKESIKGIKFLVLIYPRDGSNYLAVGPVFNYVEGY